MTNIKSTIEKTRAWIGKNRYHGLEKDTAERTGLSKETVRAHMKTGTPETKATNTVLDAAMDLILDRQKYLQEKLAKTQEAKT